MSEIRLEQLLEKELEWEGRRFTAREDDWLIEGILLYCELIQLQPTEERFKNSQKKLLRQIGNFYEVVEAKESAIEAFLNVVKIDPGNRIAKYHLGIWYFIQCQWQKALECFNNIKHQEELSLLEYTRLLCCCAICCDRMGDISQREEKLAKAVQVDVDKKYLVEISYIKALIDRDIYPYIVFVGKQKPRPITQNQVDKILFNSHKDYLVLDLQPYERGTNRKCCFIGPLTTVNLQPKEAEVLQYLITYKKTTPTQLLDTIWTDVKKPNIVKSYIRRLRKSLQPCFEQPIDEIIINRYGSGYEWKYHLSCKIIAANPSYITQK